MRNTKNKSLEVAFSNKIHRDIKLAAELTGLSFCKVAVKAMRLGLAAIMAMDTETLKEELK